MSKRLESTNTYGHELRIVFLNGSSAQFVTHELVDLLFRPRTLWVMGFFSIALSVISLNPLRSGLPYWAMAFLTLMDFILFTVVFTGILLLAETVARLYGWRRVFEPPLTIAATSLVSLASYGLSALIVGQSALERQAILLDLLTRVLLSEGLVTLYFLFVAPVVSIVAAAERTPEAPEEVSQPMLKLGRVSINPATIGRIDSEGHYLTIHHTGGQDRVLGTLGDTAARLEPFGMIVHRSHWVAFGQIGRLWRDGRTLRLDTESFGTVSVSRERVADVRARLAQGSAAP